ncbi:MAG: SpoIIE family protein phosphatase [Acidobacteriota bacterium]|jgi:sigma-B regulation protein RsbU (phosphoserine phosphatase)
MRSTSTESPANVLLVDDTPANLQVLGGMLKEQGCIVRPVPSGKLAIRFAEADPPDIILLDIMMPEMDGFEVCRRLKQIDRLKEIPIIFISALHETIDKVKAFAAGGVDYISKPFQFEEVEARVRTHLNIRRLQVQLENQNHRLSQLYQALRESQEALDSELAYAASYVASLIPPPIRSGTLQSDWLYVPSTRLGGDSLGYHWIDDAHFAFYLLDVSGHGVGPALLSVSVLNTIRTQCLPGADFRYPDQVLARLNTRFHANEQYGLYFTLWYGVFNQYDRVLRYANGGHPPAVLMEDSGRAMDLDAQGLPVGLFAETEYVPATVQISPASRVYVFSDGCYEIELPEGQISTREEMIKHLNEPASGPASQLRSLYEHSMSVHGGTRLDDDFSIVCVRF